MAWEAVIDAASWPMLIWFALSCAALICSVLLTVQGWENCRFIRKQSDPPAIPLPFVAVVVPVKGIDLELEPSLRALLHQDYPDYEVHFVGESTKDPAYAVVRKLLESDTRCAVYWHAAGVATDCGQKVHNLEVALEQISDRAEMVAFADSDAHPNDQWLRSLTFRLAARENNRGATTGYRVCVPARPSLANWLLYVINASVGGLMIRSGPFNMIWGGAWVIRRELLSRVRQQWRNTIIDDVIASRVVKRHGWRVGMEPKILVPSVSDMSLMGLMEFVRRQFFMINRYSRAFWCGAVAYWTLMVFGFWGNVAISIAAYARGVAWWWLPAAFAGAAYALGTTRVLMRQSACRSCLPQLTETLRSVHRFELVAHPIASLVGWVGLLSAGVGNGIIWRGIRYRLASDGRLLELQHPDQAEVVPEPSQAIEHAA